VALADVELPHRVGDVDDLHLCGGDAGSIRVPVAFSLTRSLISSDSLAAGNVRVPGAGGMTDHESGLGSGPAVLIDSSVFIARWTAGTGNVTPRMWPSSSHSSVTPSTLPANSKGCDRKRFQVLNTLIGPRSHPVSASLSAGAGDAYATPHPRELVHSLTASADERSRADAGPRSSLNGLASQQTETRRDTPRRSWSAIWSECTPPPDTKTARKLSLRAVDLR
jgi:hypothetical protein